MSDVSGEPTTIEDRGLIKLRSSTTLTLNIALGAYLCVAVIAQHDLVAAAVVALASGGTLLVITAWERGASNLVRAVAVILGIAAAVCAWLFEWNVMAAAPLGFAVGAMSSRWGKTASARSTSVILSSAVLGLLALALEILSGTGWRTMSTVVVSVAVLLVGLIFIFNDYVWGLVLEVDRSRRMAAEVTRLYERERLANDLHDIQGQNMTAIRMKLNVVERLLGNDLERAHHEINEIKTLIDETTKGTRELIVGNRALTVAAELANSRGLLEATGAEVHVDEIDEIPAENSRIIGRVLREATTNILKHSAAQTVEIDMGSHHVKVINDGVSNPAGESGGLASLEMRLANAGWVTSYYLEDGRFILDCHRKP